MRRKLSKAKYVFRILPEGFDIITGFPQEYKNFDKIYISFLYNYIIMNKSLNLVSLFGVT